MAKVDIVTSKVKTRLRICWFYASRNTFFTHWSGRWMSFGAGLRRFAKKNFLSGIELLYLGNLTP
jgi:hypothetical protein